MIRKCATCSFFYDGGSLQQDEFTRETSSKCILTGKFADSGNCCTKYESMYTNDDMSYNDCFFSDINDEYDY